jgi:hypothetical protein
MLIQSFKIIKLTIVFFISFVLPVFSATYYVDYISGNDTNNGASTSTPFKHCPGDQDATDNADITLSAGDTVVFHGGVTYSFDETGYNYIAANASGTDAEKITYTSGHLETPQWGTTRAIIDFTNATPNSAGLNGCIYLSNYTDITISGLELKNYAEGSPTSVLNYVGFIGWIDGNTGTQADILIDNILAHTSNGLIMEMKGKYTAGGDAASNITIQNSTFYDTGAHCISIRYAWDNVLIFNNNIDQAGSNPYSSSTPRGNPIALATSDLFGGQSNVTVRSNDIADTTATDNKGFMLIEGTQGQVNLTLEDNYFHGTPRVGPIMLSAAFTNLIIRNNVFHVQPTNFEGILRFRMAISGNASSDGISIYNNTFVCEPALGSSDGIIFFTAVSDPDVKYSNVSIKNNIIDSDTETNSSLIYIGNTTDGSNVPVVELSTLDIDYNAYQSLNSSFQFYADDAADSTMTFAQWKTWLNDNGVSGGDAHSNFGQVAFTNESGNNLTLSADDTIAKDEGTTLSGFTDDKDGYSRPYGSDWDIGAYEWPGTQSAPPTKVIFIE